MSRTVRFATFNVALYRSAPGRLLADLSTPDDPQARTVAEVIQHLRPDVLLLCEFDYDPEGRALALFQDNYLRIGRHGAAPLRYPHALALPSNTGLPSGLDLNRDGVAGGPDDALGFGAFPGQYAFALLSRYPLDLAGLRSFRTLLWRDLPGARLPEDWYPPPALERLPLSSKNHIDLPVRLPKGTVHVLAAHPVPPAFDGPERRNARRNFDEIRLLAEYLSPHPGPWLRDDAGRSGGLAAGERFVIMGDLNADPARGGSLEGAMGQLLDHPRLHRDAADGPLTPTGSAGRDTADWGLRVDYVLPSRDLAVSAAGVFWPPPGDELVRLLGGSDHRPVWVDVAIP